MVKLDGLRDFNNISRYTALITNGLTLLILIVSANYIGKLFPNSVQKELENNYLFKHIIAFLSCVTYCIVNNGEIKNIYEQFIGAIFIYIVFILITKVQFSMFLIIITIAFISFMIHLYKQYTLTDIDQYYISGNNINTSVDVDTLVDLNINLKYLEQYNLLTYIQFGIFIVISMLSIIGFLSHMNTSWNKYGHNYSGKFKFVIYLFDFVFRKAKYKYKVTI
jgi:hypothetical protein